MQRLLSSLFIALAAAAPMTAAAYERLPESLARLAPADFARDVQVADDPLEPSIVFSTQAGYKRGRSLAGAYASDVHLRAVVERATGQVTWQVWHELVSHRGHKDLTVVHYLSGGNVQTAQPVGVDKWLDQCPPTDGIGSCNQVTRVGFSLPAKTVRELAAAYSQGSREPWRLRFKDASGNDVTGGLAPAEAAGLIAAVEAWGRGPA